MHHVILLVAVLLAGCSGLRAKTPGCCEPTQDGDPLTLMQNWSEADRAVFYHTPQGSPILPYDWFLALEQPQAEAPFRERAHLESFGMVYWGSDPDLNPDGLPVGLTRDTDIYGQDAMLGMNCGACHTDVIHYKGHRILVDGSGAHFDFWRFMQALDAALEETRSQPPKFIRFAGTLLNKPQPSEAELDALARQLDGQLDSRREWRRRNDTDLEPGPGRVDALNIILNQVTAGMLQQPENAKPPGAPVSFPYVWDAPYLDCVQYNGAVPNAGAGAVGRNVGQVLGVFGQAVPLGAKVPPGYPNSVRTHNLLALEDKMQSLRSPSWQELAARGVLPPLDSSKVEAGRQLYATHCKGCHQLIEDWPRELASIPVTRIPASEIGTDATSTNDFADRRVRSGPLRGRKLGYLDGPAFGEDAAASDVLVHMTTGVMINDLSLVRQLLPGILGAKLGQWWDSLLHRLKLRPSREEAATAMLQGGGSQEQIDRARHANFTHRAHVTRALQENGLKQDGPDADKMPDCADNNPPRYRAKPLNGVWATGPFLHNGSVPSLAHLLKLKERPERFHVGSREFDPTLVGFVSEAVAGSMEFNTSLPGNSNAGHDGDHQGVNLSDAEKWALLEYLKSL